MKTKLKPDDRLKEAHAAGVSFWFSQQWIRCGNQACKRCPEGMLHGPYWYVHYYQTGKMKSIYLGKELTKYALKLKESKPATA